MAQKKRKLSYWERRDIAAEKKINDGAINVEEVVAKAYRQAQSYLTEKVRKLFARSQQRSGLSEEEARRILNETTSIDELTELKKLAKQIKDPKMQEAANNRLKALAFKERITRSEDLKAKSFLVSKQIADVQLEKQTDFYIDAIHESYKEATAEAVIRQAQVNAKNGVVIEVWNKKDYQFKELSTRYTKNILDSHWHGSNYSKRLWGDTEALAAGLEELFTVESMTGMSEFEMAKAIASEFDRSIGVARRLIRTEANYMANQAKLKAWQDSGVKYYMLVAVLDLRTSEICKGKDHKVYLVSQAVVNGADGTYPPFHPWCRTIAVMYSKRTLKLPKNALDPITGKVIPIKGETTYNDWMNKLKEMYSDDEIYRQKLIVKNAASDNSDYKQLKNILGKENAPKSLEEYQNIKYNNGEQWKALRISYLDKKIQNKILSGAYNLTINPDKQGKHILGHVGYKDGRSYLLETTDPQELVNKYAGTGTIQRNRKGIWNNHELIVQDEFIGVNSSVDGTLPFTNRFYIHYSKTGTHIVPTVKGAEEHEFK